ncbi:phosphatase PAP2 family protein [Dyadobacter tibetensis]|uniref:phosphatase PAP2 family protein n=1 Tax=Dyadobacter tibetensis TaxID=1211851 RepID=UPI0004705F65|nr:phosphatase PAP2 family protein [Dyadobacter tibetensis]
MIPAKRRFLLFFFSIWIILGIAQAIFGQNQILFAINDAWNPIFDATMPYLTHLGDGIFCIIIGILTLLISYRLGGCILISYLFSGLFVQFLKRMVFTQALRPPVVLASHLPNMHLIPDVTLLQHGSFPSGHTTSAFALFMTIALYSRPKWIQGACLMAATLVAFTRMYLLAHFPADVWVGAMTGGVFAVASLILVERFATNFAKGDLDRGLLRF